MSAVKNELWHWYKLQATFTYIANIQQQTLVELLQNSTLVTKAFIQNAQCPESNTANCETKGCIHPQVMCDWNKADHCRFHFKETGLQSFTTSQFNILGISHKQNSYEHLKNFFSYLSASVALFKHKPKDKIISKSYCSKADFPLLFSPTPASYSVQSHNASQLILLQSLTAKKPTFRKAVHSRFIYL